MKLLPYHQTGLALGLAAAMLLSVACSSPEVKVDENSGSDMDRVGARKIFPGQKITDSINAPVGDNTDWKEIPIRERGTMAVTVSLDDTNSLRGFVSLKDTFGIELGRQPISPSNAKYTFDRVPVYPGTYFVQVFADTGKSVYTAGVNFEPLIKRTAAPRAKTIPGKKPTRPRFIRSTRDKPPEEATTTTKEPEEKVTPKETKTPEATKEPVDLTKFRTVSGTIIRITPRENGGAILQISGCGSSDGVASSMSGTIKGIGKGITITQVRPNGATAVTRADAETIKTSSTVVVRVPK